MMFLLYNTFCNYGKKSSMKYYIVFETDHKKVSNIIDTKNDLDTSVGLSLEMAKLDYQYNSNVIILSWKRLDKHWWSK